MRNQNVNSIITGGISLIVLNAVENAIERYGHRHRNFIGNVYSWFSLKLGYKNPRFLYRVFQMRRDAKLGYRDIIIILKITQDQTLYDAIVEDLQNTMQSKIDLPNQLDLL